MSITHKRLRTLSLFTCGLLFTGYSHASTQLHSAVVRVALTSPRSCEVTMALEAAASDDVDHRVEAFAGTEIELVAVRGAETASDRRIGSTRSLVVRPVVRKPYQIQYRITQPRNRAFRCPLWVPALATDGRSRPVTITVALPEGSSPKGSSFPALEWAASEGVATLAHLPAFVRVSYVGGGAGDDAGPLDVARAMDTIAVAVMALATAGWVWRRRRA